MPARQRCPAAGSWNQWIARGCQTQSSSAQITGADTPAKEGETCLNYLCNYFCFGARRARSLVRSEETAKTPPASPASTSVGFSGESSQPLCARAGRATIRGIASATDRMAFFIFDPCLPRTWARDIESFVLGGLRYTTA